ncbi:unnamed protein product, partial [Staurois parvus]
MALGRKGLTCGAIKGLNVLLGVFLLTAGCVSVLCCNHTALDGCAVHSHPKQCARADRENCFLY